MKLSADDTKTYRQMVDPIKDPQPLQMDLSNLMKWAREWQLPFNTDKCESMRITHTRDKSVTQHMLDKPLKDVKSQPRSQGSLLPATSVPGFSPTRSTRARGRVGENPGNEVGEELQRPRRYDIEGSLTG